MKEKKDFRSLMSRKETANGWLLLPVYFVALPFLLSLLSNLLHYRFQVRVQEDQVNLIYYGLMAVGVLFLFRSFLGASLRRLFQKPAASAAVVLAGFFVYFGLQVLLSPLAVQLKNLNNERLVSQALQNPLMICFMTVVLAPLVEETLFRGVVFGSIRKRSRILAYLISALLFSLLHVWQQVFTTGDFSYLLLLLQYLAPSVVLAWCYEKNGSIWASMLLHGAINGVSLISVLK
ncbi:MAG: CPBP family intramembrane metalloprotease [Oscillospiraceae bacterium]|nr:CPBP family intramembrane metalloprotease [Oscillospiraceae bacterium]